MISITHRDTGTSLCEFDVSTLREANLREADLSGADLRGADLRGANLHRANLYGANLREADLYGANLSEANLRGADLYGADLYGANLCGANLSGADLRGANLYGADLHRANLYGADLCGANLGEKFGKLILDGFLSVGPLGSRNGTLLAFHTDKGIFVRAGCFFDSLQLFRESVIKTHGEESKHGKLYLGVANIIEFKFSEEA